MKTKKAESPMQLMQRVIAGITPQPKTAVPSDRDILRLIASNASITRDDCREFALAALSRPDPLDTIHAILDEEGEEWDSETMSAVAEVITDLGYTIRDPNDFGDADDDN